jgi:hypothetical protein
MEKHNCDNCNVAFERKTTDSDDLGYYYCTDCHSIEKLLEQLRGKICLHPNRDSYLQEPGLGKDSIASMAESLIYEANSTYEEFSLFKVCKNCHYVKTVDGEHICKIRRGKIAFENGTCDAFKAQAL